MTEIQILYAIAGGLGFLLLMILGAVSGISKKLDASNKIAAANGTALKNIANNLATYNQQDSFINNLDIVYQELAHHLTPVMKALEIQPRQTFEHNIWRMTGGLVDAKDQNPFVLEQLRRNIKLDSEFANNVDSFLFKAKKMLERMAALDPDGILAAAFSDGLLGQTITIFTSAQQLAAASKNDRN
ncbi:MAG: hypothetical protein LBG89_02755 [Rickettsiales bacterium]|jgi:dsDNA-specific endonuclease/ATPase MutS2|nr:hypothetical protein [Rickettsiales bacterium]